MEIDIYVLYARTFCSILSGCQWGVEPPPVIDFILRVHPLPPPRTRSIRGCAVDLHKTTLCLIGYHGLPSQYRGLQLIRVHSRRATRRQARSSSRQFQNSRTSQVEIEKIYDNGKRPLLLPHRIINIKRIHSETRYRVDAHVCYSPCAVELHVPTILKSINMEILTSRHKCVLNNCFNFLFALFRF